MVLWSAKTKNVAAAFAHAERDIERKGKTEIKVYIK